MAKCLECTHWKPCFNGKEWDAAIGSPCKYFAPDIIVGGKWIPVTEQEEPTENGTYLCHGYWFGSRRKQTETADFFGEWNIANNFILTHWMPLPEPPMRKGEDDGQL